MAGQEAAEPAQLKAMLAPYPSDRMTCWPVSARVGSVKNNDPSLVEPVELYSGDDPRSASLAG